MARTLMILGTHSHAGKSAMVTAFCRILACGGFWSPPSRRGRGGRRDGPLPDSPGRSRRHRVSHGHESGAVETGGRVRLDEGGADEVEVTCRIAVIQFPHIAKFDEFEVLAAEPGLKLRYIRDADALARPDAAILPRTKTTLSDLNWLRERQLDGAILAARRDSGDLRRIPDALGTPGR